MVELAVYMVDAGGQILSCTAGAQDLQGYAAMEIVGQSFDCLFSDEERVAQVPAALLAAGIQGQSRQNARLLRKDGNCFRANLDIHVLRDAGGTILGFAVSVQNAAEKAMGKPGAKNGRIAAQPVDFHLPENGAVAPSGYGLAHDINNMLAVISTSIELISRYPEDLERVQRMVGNIKQALARAESLTKRFSPAAAEQHGELDAATHADPLGDLAAGLASVMQADKGREKKPAALEK